MQVFMYYSQFKNDWKLQKFFVSSLFSVYLCDEETLIVYSFLINEKVGWLTYGSSF